MTINPHDRMERDESAAGVAAAPAGAAEDFPGVGTNFGRSTDDSAHIAHRPSGTHRHDMDISVRSGRSVMSAASSKVCVCV